MSHVEELTSDADVTPAVGRRACIAVDLGAESCRVSLLRWVNGEPEISMVHRFTNGPVERDGGLFWPLAEIVAGVESGLRRCAEIATEGVASIAVDGWAVDYVRLDAEGVPLTEPFCYRDERTIAAQEALHLRITPERVREITGVPALRINTVYQLHADTLAGLPTGERWLNLPEYLLHRWGGDAVAEHTNATHTAMVDLYENSWSAEIVEAGELNAEGFPPIVPAGTVLGELRGPLAELPAFAGTKLIAPACHDTASAIAGIPAAGDDWAYISSGTWSLVGTTLAAPGNSASTREQGFMNLGGVGGSVCFHKSVNGMWLVSQCLNAWKQAGVDWSVEDLMARAAEETHAAEEHGTAYLLDVDDPELMLVGDMPRRINMQLRSRGLAEMDESPSAAPAMAALILRSLADRYAQVLAELQAHSGKTIERIFVVGGGSRNALLTRLTEQATGLRVLAGSAESSTVGNFAVQLATLADSTGTRGESFAQDVARWAQALT